MWSSILVHTTFIIKTLGEDIERVRQRAGIAVSELSRLRKIGDYKLSGII